MKSKFTRILLAMAFVVSVCCPGSNRQRARPLQPPAPPSLRLRSDTGPGTKIGTISMEQAIFATNEGRRDFEALSKKLEPKQNELKGQNDEIESLQKQLNTQGDKLNEDARANLVKQIETKKKSLDALNCRTLREDAQNQQNEIAQRILQKLGPVLIKYATDNGFGMIMDTSQPWPQSPVVWWGESVDVTKPVVDVYNAQSGVAAPPASGAAKPAGPISPAELAQADDPARKTGRAA